MLAMYLPSWVLLYLLYLSSRFWSCTSPWLLTPALPKDLESPGFALQLAHTLLLLDKRQPPPSRWEPTSVIKSMLT